MKFEQWSLNNEELRTKFEEWKMKFLFWSSQNGLNLDWDLFLPSPIIPNCTNKPFVHQFDIYAWKYCNQHLRGTNFVTTASDLQVTQSVVQQTSQESFCLLVHKHQKVKYLRWKNEAVWKEGIKQASIRGHKAEIKIGTNDQVCGSEEYIPLVTSELLHFGE